MPSIDKLIDDMFMKGLPADSYKDIAGKLGVTKHQVNMALTTLRSDPTKYGWTVPHVKRGKHLAGEEDRFYIVLLQPDGRVEYDHARQGHHLSSGLRSDLSLWASQSHNEAIALRAVAEHTSEPVVIRMLERLAGQLEVVENQCIAVLAAM